MRAVPRLPVRGLRSPFVFAAASGRKENVDRLICTYQRAPPDDPLPPWHPELDAFEPCYFEWEPEMWCSTEARKRGLLALPIDIPWSWNVVEVRVQSRKTAQALDRVARPAARFPLVRILPPKPAATMAPTKQLDLVLCLRDARDTNVPAFMARLAGSTMAVRVGALWQHELRASRVVIFPWPAVSSLDHLADAISFGCRIVSGDGGASEEWLTRYAPPRAWHVVHDRAAETFAEAAKGLLGLPSDFRQTFFRDDDLIRPLTQKQLKEK